MKHIKVLILFTIAYTSLFSTQGDMEELTENKLKEFVIDSIREVVKSGAKNSPLPNAGSMRFVSACVHTWGVNYVTLNSVIQDDFFSCPSQEEVHSVLSHYKKTCLPFIWWSGAQILEENGMIPAGVLAGVAFDLTSGLPKKPQVSPDIAIKRAQTKEEIDLFTQIACRSFGVEGVGVKQWSAVNKAMSDSSMAINYIAYFRNTPVGTATLTTTETTSGIWNLTTDEAYRKRGIGTALVYACLEEAKARDYKACMACLMPSGLAWGLLETFGFQNVVEIPFHIKGIKLENLKKKVRSKYEF